MHLYVHCSAVTLCYIVTLCYFVTLGNTMSNYINGDFHLQCIHHQKLSLHFKLPLKPLTSVLQMISVQ